MSSPDQARRAGGPAHGEFAVAPGEVEAAAARVATCAADIRAVSRHWSASVASAGMAMPEPASTPVPGAVHDWLDRLLEARAGQVDELAAGLRDAARSYTGTDAAAADAAGSSLDPHGDRAGGASDGADVHVPGTIIDKLAPPR